MHKQWIMENHEDLDAILQALDRAKNHGLTKTYEKAEAFLKPHHDALHSARLRIESFVEAAFKEQAKSNPASNPAKRPAYW